MAASKTYTSVEEQKPAHPREGGHSCVCTTCDNWRAIRVIPGSLVIGMKLDPKEATGSGSPTWRPEGPFVWGEPVSVPALVIGDVPEGAPGGHLSAVLLYVPSAGLRVTSRMWLLVLEGGRTA